MHMSLCSGHFAMPGQRAGKPLNHAAHTHIPIYECQYSMCCVYPQLTNITLIASAS